MIFPFGTSNISIEEHVSPPTGPQESQKKGLVVSHDPACHPAAPLTTLGRNPSREICASRQLQPLPPRPPRSDR
ncbi:hypothetical protein E2C01_080680 [Portunus trituberculatus]|uniref:Uncharacterized protein n=1 Tax=Portunus trituberculatus TaxID=210409 RepID=A0A5B7IKA3_PORTR|nr:hypothetical protein [Portunus trituberculatus]